MKSREEHNASQRSCFSGRRLPRMEPELAATPYVRRHVDAFLAAVALRPDDRVLDVGCGLGKYTIALAHSGARVEGLDLTPALLDRLRISAPGLPLHLGDVADPPTALHGAFDIVAGFFVLHHVADLDATFAGVARCLRPGGRAAFLEPNPWFPGTYLQIAFTPGMSWKEESGLLRLRPRLLGEAAARAGFSPVRVERFGAFPPALVNRSLGRWMESAVEAVPGWEWARAFQLVTAELLR